MSVEDNSLEGDPTPSSTGRRITDKFLSSAVHSINPGSKSIVNVDKAVDDVFVSVIWLVGIAPNTNNDASNFLGQGRLCSLGRMVNIWTASGDFIVILVRVIIDGLSLSLMKGSYDLIVFLFLVADDHSG
jgi:hypothetical protein